MSNETIEDALCDMYDIRERSKVHKFDVLAKDGDGTDTTIGDCIKNVIDVLENYILMRNVNE
tara:strand:+ start:331 stop:516 length:186 start_codon:yes stop_codon:yes gene_type:complete